MEEKMKELVGIAAAVSGHCRPCFHYHYGKARELGVPMKDINEAVDLAIRISASGDNQMQEFVKKATNKGDGK